MEKSAIIFYCEDNFGNEYKYAKVCDIGKEQETIAHEENLSTEIYDTEIISCYV